MYEKLNITENHLQVLVLFTKGYTREYYIREVQKLLGISPRTAQLILDDLEDKAVLESVTKGKIKVYRIKKSEVAKDFLALVEQYKKIAFLGKNAMIKEIVEKITPHIDGIGIIFGSYAKGLQKKDSDLDIFISGKHDANKIKYVSRLYGLEISVKNYPMKVFENNIKSDTLIREIMDNHVIFLNAERFVKAVLGHG